MTARRSPFSFTLRGLLLLALLVAVPLGIRSAQRARHAEIRHINRRFDRALGVIAQRATVQRELEAFVRLLDDYHDSSLQVPQEALERARICVAGEIRKLKEMGAELDD